MYLLEGLKVKDYEDFKKVALLMDKKAHLTVPQPRYPKGYRGAKEGLEEIREIKNQMNTKREI
jgi:hypothetical protein